MSVETFVREVRAFAAFVEGSRALTIDERLAAARVRLLAVYTAVLDVRYGGETGGHAREHGIEPPVRPDFGDKDLYWEVFDPYEMEEPVASSLGCDVQEIYSDLVGPLRLWDAGHSADAIWHWRQGFGLSSCKATVRGGASATVTMQ